MMTHGCEWAKRRVEVSKVNIRPIKSQNTTHQKLVTGWLVIFRKRAL